ncbi:MAG: hypothetical protein WBD55_04630, partial [Dehalococcoidia bacterium]
PAPEASPPRRAGPASLPEARVTTDEETQVRKRRRRRRGRRGGAGARREPAQAAETAEGPSSLGWEWRTFPVFFAFAAGLLLMGIAWPIPGIGATLFFAGIGGVAYGVAHILTRTIIARRRR